MNAEVRAESASQVWGLWFSAASSTLLPAHRHDCSELNLLMSGSLAYRLEGRSELLEAHAGQLIAIPRGTTHELVRSSEDLTLWVIELKGADGLGWASSPRVLSPAEAWRKSVLLAVRRLWLRPPRKEALEIQAHLWKALLPIELTELHRDLPVHPAVSQAKAVCERLGDGKLDIAGLARASGLSSSRLAHLFGEQLGITPLQYRNFARIQYFIRNYDGDRGNLLPAALWAGFGSYAQFHRAFRQVCGEPPAVHFRWLTGSNRIDAKRTLGSMARIAAAKVHGPSSR